jgi:hypothetical protein
LTAALLLERATRNPEDGAGSLIETVHRSVPVPAIVELAQENPTSCVPPVPLRGMDELPVERLLLTIS